MASVQNAPAVPAISQNDQIALEEKNLKKAEKCQKALQGTSIGLSSLGVITLLATAIILMAAPLLLPAIAFKALLLSGAAILILGTALAVAAIAKSCKKISPQEEKLQNELKDSIAQQTALSGQVRQSETQRTQMLTEKEAIESKLKEAQTKLDEKNLELATAESTLQTLQNEKDPQGFLPQLTKQKEVNQNLQNDLIQMTEQKNNFEAQLKDETDEKAKLGIKLNETGDELALVRKDCEAAQQQNGLDAEAIKSLKESVQYLEKQEIRFLENIQHLDDDNRKYISQSLLDKEEIESLEVNAGNLQKEIKELKRDIDDLNDEIDDLKKAKESNFNAFTKADQDLKLLEKQLEETYRQHNEKLRANSTELSDKEGELQAAEAAKSNLTRQLTEAQVNFEHDYNTLVTNYDAMKKGMKALETDFNTQKEVLESTLTKNEALQEEIASLKTPSGEKTTPLSPMSSSSTRRTTLPTNNNNNNNNSNQDEGVKGEETLSNSAGSGTLPITNDDTL